MSIDISKLFAHELLPLNDIKTCKTTIRITSGGLSVFMNNGDQLAYCASFQWAQSNDVSLLEEALTTLLKEEPLCNIDLNLTTILLDDEGYVFVPQSLFDENELNSYLTHQIAPEKLAESKAIFTIVNEIVCISIINKQLFNITESLFPYATIEAYNSAFLKTTAPTKANTSDFLGLISFQGDSFDLQVKKRGQLIFFNRFKFATKEDFIYFLMMTVQQLEIKPSTIELFVIGKIDSKSALYSLMNTYFPSVELIKSEAEVAWDFHRYFVEQKY